MEKPKPKFVFQCQRCGICCENKEDLPVNLTDIERWTKDGSIYEVSSHLSIVESFGIFTLQIDREDGICKMYDPEKKECIIYSSRPISCKAFPLRYNGKNYTIRDKKCPGLDQEKMTAEELKEIREASKSDYEGEDLIMKILPTLQSIIMRDIAEKSKEAYEGLTEEQREKLKEMFG
ncbi:MAG: YkgJ family cysteine cluster protein [Halobacteriota archaeon]|nr:YkgJ family cysteine cluster protein [Halobacteriota archaeon]